MSENTFTKFSVLTYLFLKSLKILTQNKQAIISGTDKD